MSNKLQVYVNGLFKKIKLLKNLFRMITQVPYDLHS